MVCMCTHKVIIGNDLRRYITLTCEHGEADSVVGVAVGLFWLLHLIVSFAMTLSTVVHSQTCHCHQHESRCSLLYCHDHAAFPLGDFVLRY